MSFGRCFPLASALLVAFAWAGCEPQDIYLFETVSRSGAAGMAGGGAQGVGPEAGQPDAPEPRSPPACESPECESCAADAMRCRAEGGSFFCHPRSGECALACNPQADASEPVCLSGQVCHPDYGVCVECIDRGECAAGILRECDTRSGACVECVEAADCAVPGQSCDPISFTCVSCVMDVDCAGSEDRFCLPSEGRCVECRTSADCTLEPDRRICSSEFECED